MMDREFVERINKSYQRGINVRQRQQLVIHAMDLLILETTLLKVRVGKVEKRIAIQYTINGAFQDVGTFISKDFGSLHILYLIQIVD